MSSPKPIGEWSDHGAGGSAYDPTGTTTLRQRYASRLRAAWEPIEREIRRAADDDVFGLGGAEALSGPTLEALAEPVDVYPFASSSQKVDQFESWLRSEIDDGVLEAIHRGDNEFIRSAYVKGARDAHRDAQHLDDGATAGLSTPEPDEVFRGGVHRESVEQLFTRNFEQLEGIAADTADAVREELAEGYASGEGPRKTARRMNNRIDSIGKHRSTVLARTETINAYNEAKLNQFERLGYDEIETLAEASAVGDNRTCEICAGHDGTRASIREFRQGERPPYHPQCRCTILPIPESITHD